ncbi:helix-turn-helix domain-containing protein [Roseateles sp. DC23W]|uniref:Helix-turn-helix domain-containing protein n=1 Tax=Pelomonas dachongensis TaxID=3299029 RepID=A0ABW7EMB5_9BURK
MRAFALNIGHKLVFVGYAIYQCLVALSIFNRDASPCAGASAVDVESVPASSSALLFGNDHCKRFNSPQDLADALLPFWPHLQDMETVPGHGAFQGRLAALPMPGLSALAVGVSGLRMAVHDNVSTALTFPLQGNTLLRIDGRRFNEYAGSGCFFIPAGTGPQYAECSGHNACMLQIDRQLLTHAARAVLGLQPGEPVELDCDRPRVVGAEVGPATLALARHLGATMELHACNPQLLDRLGFQDFVYRQLVLLFRPDWQSAVRQQRQPSGGPRRRAIDRVCDAMLSDLSGRHTVSALSALSGMSARGLQYAFKSRFGQSPLQWLREQRLEHARRKLLGGTHDSITQIAMDCGFATASSFSAFYRSRFGELPTATRGRRA